MREKKSSTNTESLFYLFKGYQKLGWFNHAYATAKNLSEIIIEDYPNKKHIDRHNEIFLNLLISDDIKTEDFDLCKKSLENPNLLDKESLVKFPVRLI